MKKATLLLAIIAFFSIIPFVAYAHPGRTDGSGGHRNRSTGEYHWHHGGSAHQHYDIDNDGDLDCPRSFNYARYHINNYLTSVKSNMQNDLGDSTFLINKIVFFLKYIFVALLIGLVFSMFVSYFIYTNLGIEKGTKLLLIILLIVSLFAFFYLLQYGSSPM